MLSTYQERKANWQGMNWIRQESRLAIYLRDGLSCAYCGDSAENGAQLTLDHIKPHNHGGDNKPNNLITCCHRCNCSRGKRSIVAFAKATAEYLDHGVTAMDIAKHIAKCRHRKMPPYRQQAKDLIALRGSAARVLAEQIRKA